MGKKLLFLYNPNSGKSQIKNKLFNIVNEISEFDWEIRIYPTKGPKDAVGVVSSVGKEFDFVVISGGDGTLNEAVTGLMAIPEEERPPIGYIPAGTTNDFATSMGIPKIMEKACHAAMIGEKKYCDVGTFNEHYFVYVAAFGAFTSVTYETSQKFKSMFGYAAYLMEGVKQLPSIKKVHMKMTYDDDNVVEGDYILGLVSNSTSVAGLKYSKKLEISMNDGEFECILIKNPSNPIDFQLAFKDLIMQNMESSRIEYFKFSKAKIETEHDIKWTLDGEFGGSHNVITIENIKSAIEVIA